MLDVEPVVAVDAVPSATWGDGRALMARTAANGTTAVLTTIGIYVIDGAEITPVEVFQGPTEVAAMELTPDGASLVVATGNPSRLSWYDLRNDGPPVTEELDPATELGDIEFGTDGDLIVTTDRGLVTWPDGPGSGPIPLTDPDVPVGRAAAGPDGHLLAPVLGTSTIARLDEAGFAPFTIESIGAATVLDARSANDGDVVAVTVGEGPNAFERKDRVLVLDPRTLAVLAEIPFDRSLDVDDWIVTASTVAVADGADVDVWGLDGSAIATITGSTGVDVSRLLAIGESLVIVHADGGIDRWQLGADRSTTVDGGGIRLVDMIVDVPTDSLTTVDAVGRVVVREFGPDRLLLDSDEFAIGELTAVAIDATGTRVAVSSTIGRTTLLDESLAVSAELDATDERIDTVEFDPVADILATGLAERVGEVAFDDTVTSWDVPNGTTRFRLGGESEDVAGCAFFYNRIRFTSDGALMATTSHDFTVSIVDATTGTLVHRLTPSTTTTLDIAFTPEDDRLVTTADDSMVRVWNTSDFSLAAEFPSATGGYLAIAILPGSTAMAVTDITGAIGLVDLVSGERLLEFDGAAERTTSLALSRDGRLLAAPATDSTIGIWSVASGARLATLTGHTAPVSDLAFAPDGSWIASTSLDATVRTWTISTTA